LSRNYFYLGVYAFVALIYICSAIYFIMTIASNKQATIGMQVCGIFVGKSSDAAKIPSTKSIARYIAFSIVLFLPNLLVNIIDLKFVSYVIIYVCFAIVLLQWYLDCQKATLYDKLLNTRVYSGKPNNNTINMGINYQSIISICVILLFIFASCLPLLRSPSLFVIISPLLVVILAAISYLYDRKISISNDYINIRSQYVSNMTLLFYATLPIYIGLIVVYVICLFPKLLYQN